MSDVGSINEITRTLQRRLVRKSVARRDAIGCVVRQCLSVSNAHWYPKEEHSCAPVEPLTFPGRSDQISRYPQGSESTIEFCLQPPVPWGCHSPKNFSWVS